MSASFNANVQAQIFLRMHVVMTVMGVVERSDCNWVWPHGALF